MRFSNSIIFLSLAAVVSALSSPHIARAHVHRAVAARVAGLESIREPHVAPVMPKRSAKARRGPSGRRCKPKPSASSSTEPAPTVKAAAAAPPTSTEHPEPAPTQQAPPPTQPHNDDNNDNGGNNNNNDNNNNNNGGHSGVGDAGGFFAGTNTGEATFYTPGLGACGITNGPNDMIVAVSHSLFDAFPGADGNPNHNPICNKGLTVTLEGKTIHVTVTDRCEGCAPTDLDFTPGAFAQIADHGRGRVGGMTWHWD